MPWVRASRSLELPLTPTAMPTALITGITGQDGSYLAELLLAKGYRVVGVVRRSSTTPYERIAHLVDRVELVSADLLDQTSLTDVVHDTQPDEIYNLAAQSFVQTSWTQPVLTGEFTALGVTRMLEAMKKAAPKARFYQASSSEMFGKVVEVPQREIDAVLSAQPVRRGQGLRPLDHGELPRELRPVRRLGDPVQPREPAARPRVRDAQGHRRRGAQSSSASRTTLRARQPRGAARLGLRRRLRRRDVAHAPAGRAGRLRRSRTGETWSVRELCEVAFEAVGLDYRDFVKHDPKFVRPAEVDLLVGDPSKAREQLGWEPTVRFRRAGPDDGRGRPRAARRRDVTHARAGHRRQRVRRAVGDPRACSQRGWTRRRRPASATRRPNRGAERRRTRARSTGCTMDVTDRTSVARGARRAPSPDVVLHLAGDQPRARRDAQSGARLRGERGRRGAAARATVERRRAAGRGDPVVLVVGSAEQYGRHERDEMPLRRAGGAATAHALRGLEGGAGDRRAAGVPRARACGVDLHAELQPLRRRPGAQLPAAGARGARAARSPRAAGALAIGNGDTVRDFLHVDGRGRRVSFAARARARRARCTTCAAARA